MVILTFCVEFIYLSCYNHFMDKNLVESFWKADVDFVIWMTPYKNLPGNPRVYPQICVFDLRRKDKWKKDLVEYNVDEMMCLERLKLSQFLLFVQLMVLHLVEDVRFL